jgi:WD40 repeat protein
VLVSVSHDRTMRFWDLHTRHEMDVVERAHDTPIHTLAYCEENEELATAAHEPIVKIWCSYKHSLKAVLTGHVGDVSQVRPWRLPHPLFKFRNNAQFAAQLAASISHVALIGPN